MIPGADLVASPVAASADVQHGSATPNVRV